MLKAANLNLKKIALVLGLCITSLESLEAKVTLINVFEVPEDKLKETIKMWESSRDFLKDQPGYISTKLHESIDESARFRLINVAEWKDEASFKQAIVAMKKSGKITMAEGVISSPGLYQVIRTDN